MPKRRLFSKFRDFLRASFIAGFFVALPTALTMAVLLWVWDYLDGPLSQIFKISGKAPGMWQRTVNAIQTDEFGQLFVPLMGLFVLMIVVLLLGVLVRSFIGRYVLGMLESWVSQVPLVGMLYSSVKQLSQAFMDEDSKSKFQSAVLVQFPMKGCWAIGFVTGSASGPLSDTMAATLRADAEALGEPIPDIVTVFVPTTPLPTQGFTLVLPKSETRELPISVNDAIKLVISGGIAKSSGESAPRAPIQP